MPESSESTVEPSFWQVVRADPVAALQSIPVLALMLRGALLMISPMLILPLEAVTWLRFGEWPGWTLHDALWNWFGIYPYTASWVGLDRIIDFFVQLPLWLAAPILGFAIFYPGVLIGSKVAEGEKARKAQAGK